MAYRTSARLFCRFFELLATEPRISRARLVAAIWQEVLKCDFHPCQMECNEVLARLGLARKSTTDDGYVYGPVPLEILRKPTPTPDGRVIPPVGVGYAHNPDGSPKDFDSPIHPQQPPGPNEDAAY